MHFISLIVATLNRKSELEDLLASLKLQIFKNFELIIVDQNLDGLLDSVIVENSLLLNIKHIKSDVKGLSLNRNIGLQYANGQIIAFPDDDCIYSKHTLECINEFFSKNQDIDIYTCNAIDLENSGNGYLSSESGKIDRYNVYNRAISFTIFIKPQQKCDIKFDSQLGVGAIYGASEETDLLQSLFMLGYCGYYDSNVFIFHPHLTSTDKKKILSYSKGFGALYHKEIFIRKNYSLILKFSMDLCKRFIYIILPFSKIIGLNKKKSHVILTLYGRLFGFFKYRVK